MKGLRDFQDPACIGLTELIAGGAGQPDWKTATASVAPDQTAAILVTAAGAGTQRDACRNHAPDRADRRGTSACERATSASRCCRCATRRNACWACISSLKHRIVSNYLENPETATENLREVKPTVFGADAEAWERLHARIDRSGGKRDRRAKAAIPMGDRRRWRRRAHGERWRI